jgi:hypothetical protein
VWTRMNPLRVGRICACGTEPDGPSAAAHAPTGAGRHRSPLCLERNAVDLRMKHPWDRLRWWMCIVGASVRSAFMDRQVFKMRCDRGRVADNYQVLETRHARRLSPAPKPVPQFSRLTHWALIAATSPRVASENKCTGCRRHHTPRSRKAAATRPSRSGTRQSQRWCDTGRDGGATLLSLGRMPKTERISSTRTSSPGLSLPPAEARGRLLR